MQNTDDYTLYYAPFGSDMQNLLVVIPCLSGKIPLLVLMAAAACSRSDVSDLTRDDGPIPNKRYRRKCGISLSVRRRTDNIGRHIFLGFVRRQFSGYDAAVDRMAGYGSVKRIFETANDAYYIDNRAPIFIRSGHDAYSDSLYRIIRDARSQPHTIT